MATGSGLPIPKGGQVLAQAPGMVSGDALFNAREWSNIAATGEKIAKEGADQYQVSVRQREVGYLAGQENEITRQQIDLRNKHANEPQVFDAAWKSYSNAKLSEAEPWAVNHMRKVLGERGNSAYSAILNERRTFDEKQDAERVTTLATTTGNEVLGAAMAGTLGTPEGAAKLQKYKGVLDSAVTSGLMTPEKRDLVFEDTLSKAEGELAARRGVEVYQEKGFDAAVKQLKSDILENEALGLKSESRYKAFNRGLSAIRLQQAQDKQDRAEFTAIATDLRARIESNQPVDPSEVRETLASLQRTGAAAEFRRLSVAAATADATAPYRSGLRLAEFATAVASRRSGVEPDLRRLRQIESGNNPNAVSPTGAKGPYQFTDATAAQYGLANPFDETASAEAVKRLWSDNAAALQSRLGRAPTGGELYLAHQQGAGGAAALLSNPAANVVDALAPAYGGDRAKAAQAITVNGGTVDMTAGQFAQKWTDKYEGVSGVVPPAGAVTQKVQQVFVQQAQAAWPDFKKKIDAGQTLNADDMNAVHYAALLSGNANWIKDVEALATANQIGLKMAGLPENQRQALIDQAQGQLSADVNASLRKQFDRQNKMVRESPVDFAIERGQAAPEPLNFSSSEAARAGVGMRVNMSRGVAEQQEVAAGSPFREADRAQIAATITRGDVKQASVAMDALSSVPDEMVVPALKSPDIKDAIGGAIRSSDPARYSAAMSFMDKMWARAPETTQELFGKDAVEALMTWQSNLRYATPDALAKEREKATLDPQVQTRMKANVEEGKKLAREYSAADITKQFDTSWWVTPGPVARALGTQPQAPVDGFTRDALMGDFETQFARRYAETLNKDVALKQTVELMKSKWAGSPVNGGRIMVNGPEKYYPAVDGSFDWMNRQIEGELAMKLGRPMRSVDPTDPARAAMIDNWNYSLVSDRQTGAEAQGGQMPSYQVVITDAQTGRMTVLPERYRFDPGPDAEKRRSDFDAQRKRVLDLANEPGFSDPMTGFSTRGF